MRIKHHATPPPSWEKRGENTVSVKAGLQVLSMVRLLPVRGVSSVLKN
jgi:hypothetical protein